MGKTCKPQSLARRRRFNGLPVIITTILQKQENNDIESLPKSEVFWGNIPALSERGLSTVSICCVSVLTPPIGRFSVTLTRVLMSMRIQSRAILKSVRIYAFLQKQSSFTRTLKPWFDKSIRSKVKAKDIAFKDKSSIPGAYLQAKADLRKSICQAKVRYCRKLEDCIDSNNARDMWSGVQAIKNYKRAKPSIDTSDNTLPDQLNHFYARFDRDNTEPVPCLTHDISEPAVLHHRP